MWTSLLKRVKYLIMITEREIMVTKNLSVAKSILAALWYLRVSGKDNLLTHKYVRLFCTDKNKGTYRSCISRLNKNKIIKKDYNDIISLTEAGKKQALFAFIEAELNLHKKDNLRWDGGWRIILFDIPERKRKYRDYLRKILKVIGFHEFQKSIWIYPFPVPSFLKEFLSDEDIKQHVRFIATNSIDNDSDLRNVFNLV